MSGVADLSLAVATPERVAVELPVAGIGTRAMAWLIDASLLFGVALALYFAWSFLCVKSSSSFCEPLAWSSWIFAFLSVSSSAMSSVPET